MMYFYKWSRAASPFHGWLLLINVSLLLSVFWVLLIISDEVKQVETGL